MSLSLKMVAFVIAFVCFLWSGAGLPSDRLNMVSLGFAALTVGVPLIP